MNTLAILQSFTRLFFDRLDQMLATPSPAITPYDPGQNEPALPPSAVRLDTASPAGWLEGLITPCAHSRTPATPPSTPSSRAVLRYDTLTLARKTHLNLSNVLLHKDRDWRRLDTFESLRFCGDDSTLHSCRLNCGS
jgi:hypothetical protein